MDDDAPRVLIGREDEFDAEWHETRTAVETTLKMPPPPGAELSLNNGEYGWLLDDFKQVRSRSDRLVMGKGFDQVGAHLNADADGVQVLQLMYQQWEFADFQSVEGRAEASDAINTIFQAYNFPSFGNASQKLALAWVWRSEALCWAYVPKGARIAAHFPGDPLYTIARAILTEGETFQKPVSDTWGSVKSNPKFYEHFPPGAPIHWALAVSALLRSLEVVRETFESGSARDFVLDSLRASYDAGAVSAEFVARRFASHVERWDQTQEIRQLKGKFEGQLRREEAEARWYGAAISWLEENMPTMRNLGIEKIYNAIIEAQRNGELSASLPGYEHFRNKFVEWEDEGRFMARSRKGKPGRPPKKS
ncbi:hypothetical protein OA2633_11385 [Oceanicaulis alexandrii HTCC2633]|uniref:hypothetical protein n=1 Tax=Oceanicaulis sp. HTCC2633 TaxID=314254 RepID=UPI0000668C57|nr:hypothetical protein [Oceanicaulis sp. HTCC2633]EAP90300.1 hypothetical protein OA2633_11385 [Oceanicaulis alexandrii HTCC2633] [Oceanicaulis sp. HTCC2633]